MTPPRNEKRKEGVMMTSREQRVRMLAYRIWESEGRPEDQEARHWEMAERIVEAENAREEEHEWRTASDEPSLLEGEEPPAEPDELGIDEMRLPLDDPETEARKEEDTGVEVTTQPGRAKSASRSKAASGGAGSDKPAPRKRATKASSAESDKVKPAPKPRKPRGKSE
ncbi:MAG: DUF2934 domain-containing protein [Pseudomonadota bacterium]|nr:DUF2934 domain-containing protein [Pseudomonadota bacterium]